MISLAPLSSADRPAIEALLDEAFGADRHGRTAYRLRAGTVEIPELSFAAFRGDALLGTIQCWPVALTDGDGVEHPLVLVGPVAVRPGDQRDGIGRMLMTAMLNAAHAHHHDALTLIGDPEYYGRFFGFTADHTGGWELPGPFERRRLLTRLTHGRTVPSDGVLGPRVVEEA
ncbi:N-acetyltransferase [Sphingomonas naphthae]|uniref:N-acetyltransferase n=1 Tax=Sphingomonas naphthae TaxID=1813468 RepID=A0ABY7THV0_9SPHN|nr:N-acetyltransferase [Sphingomonas naphthae]WCT72561.1 N-acetyltransferase [Sphingomonas naphthae]